MKKMFKQLDIMKVIVNFNNRKKSYFSVLLIQQKKTKYAIKLLL